MEKRSVYIYVKYTDRKTENEKIDNNVQRFLDKHNLLVKRLFSDGPETDEKGLIDLMNYLSIEQDINRVIAVSRSNISKDEVFVMWIEKELLKCGAAIKYIKDEQLHNPDLELLRDRVIGAFARYEKEKLPNKLAAHREYKIFETGVKSSGNCPLGYRYTGKNSSEKKVIVMEDEAATVKEIFSKYIEMKSLGRLKKYLDNKGCRTKRGKKFSRQALYNILTNKFYIGILSYNHYKYIDVNGQKRKKAILLEERRVEGKHDKLINTEIFDIANAILAENNKHKNSD